MRFGATTEERQKHNKDICWRHTIRYAYFPTKMEEGCWVWLTNYYSYFVSGKYNLRLGENKCMSLPEYVEVKGFKPFNWNKHKRQIKYFLKRSK
jgi:hypothetical protein